jgi:dTDP-4-dehydrorhamnose reductase
MTVLVTGANGQLGRDVVNLCHGRGIPCIAADSKMLDITDTIRVNEFIHTHRTEVIINCAAYNAVDLAEKEWKKAFSVNGLGVKNLVLAANQCGSVLVHYSTDYVFDGTNKRPYTIVDTPHPISRYGESKLLGENMVRDLCDHYFLVRTSWVFGKGTPNFVQKTLDWSINKTELSIVDDQISSPTYTMDLAKATLDLVSTRSFGIYHCTNSGICSRFDWAQYILHKVGWKGVLHRAKSGDFHTTAQRPEYSALDNFGIKEVLGYNLPTWQDATDRFMNEIGVSK